MITVPQQELTVTFQIIRVSSCSLNKDESLKYLLELAACIITEINQLAAEKTKTTSQVKRFLT